jgi:hypothetical protein
MPALRGFEKSVSAVFFTCPRRGHEDEVLGIELAHRQDDVDLLAVGQREHVDDRLAARVARALRHLIDLEPVQPAAVREAQDVVVRVGDEQRVDPVVFLGRRRLLAAPAALLRAVLGNRLALHVAGVRQRHHHVLRRDQVLGIEFGRVQLDLRAALVAEFGRIAQLVGDDRRDALRAGQDVEQVGDQAHHVAVLLDDLVLLQAGQALQAHLQDFLRLPSDRRYRPSAACRTAGRPSGRYDARPPAVSLSARASISRTTESQASPSAPAWRSAASARP